MSDSKLDKLEATLNDFSEGDDGTIDYMSFLTAIRSEDIDLTDEQVKSVFDELDKKNEEKILAADFIQWCRKNLIAGDGDSDNAAATSIMANIVGSDTATKSAKKTEHTPEELAEIERAVVVIKKAMLKKMSKEEVVAFLQSKGMRADLIDFAWNSAAVDQNPQQKIRHYKQLSEEKAQEASNLAYENKKMKQKLDKYSAEVERLRKTLSMSVDMVVTSSKQTSKLNAPGDVLEEVKSLAANSKGENEEKLNQLLELLQNRRFVVAWLVLQTLDLNAQLPDTQLFLEDFCPQ